MGLCPNACRRRTGARGTREIVVVTPRGPQGNDVVVGPELDGRGRQCGC